MRSRVAGRVTGARWGAQEDVLDVSVDTGVDAEAVATQADGADVVEAVEQAFELGGVLSPRLRLFSLTFLMLFVELTLIRWLGAYVVYMSYYSNFVLLGSFLGFGLGFLWSGRSARNRSSRTSRR